LQLEITESVAVQNLERTMPCCATCAASAWVAIDDFGTDSRR